MQINVTLATRTPEPLATAPTAISIVTGDDIRRAGVTTLPDAVALADGVHVAGFKQRHMVGDSARVRGSRREQNACHDRRTDGYDLIRQLRGRATQRGERIPAIVVTAYASVADRAAALESGY